MYWSFCEWVGGQVDEMAAGFLIVYFCATGTGGLCR